MTPKLTFKERCAVRYIGLICLLTPNAGVDELAKIQLRVTRNIVKAATDTAKRAR